MTNQLNLNHSQIAINIVIQTDRSLDIFQAVVNVSGLIGKVKANIKTLVADVAEAARFAGTMVGIGLRSLAWGVI